MKLAERTIVLALALSLAGCSGNATLLLVDLRTDLVAGAEFDRVRVEASSADGAPRVVETLVDAYRDYTRSAVRIAEIEGMASGPISLDVILLRGPAQEVVRRTVTTVLVEQTAVTVVITRDCRDVSCPMPGGDPAAVTCLGGECVDPGCTPETPESCPRTQCTTDEECPVPDAECSRAICVTGACLRTADPGACGADAYCDPEGGCIDRPALDAGPPDGGPDSGLPDGGPTDSGLPDSGGPGMTIPTLRFPQVLLSGAARRSDGKVIVAGTVGGDGRLDGLLLRLAPDGTLDTTFGTSGSVVHDFGTDNDRFNAVALLPDQRIVVAGESTPTSATNVDTTLARFGADGALDATFGGGALTLAHGIYGTRRDRAMALVADGAGRVTVIGDADRLWNERENYFAYRLLADGSPDTSFGVDGWTDVGLRQDNYATFAGAAADGGLWLGGPCNTFTCLVRLDAVGALDTTFSGDGVAVADYFRDYHRGNAMATAADGSVVIAADVADGDGTHDILVLRYLADGTMDPGFGVEGAMTITTGRPASATAVLLESDGHIIVGGRARRGERYDALLARVRPDGSLDASFGDAGVSHQSFDPGGSEVRALFSLSGGAVGVLAQAGHRIFYASAARGDATLPAVSWDLRLPFEPVAGAEAAPEEVLLMDGETVNGTTYTLTSPLTAHRVELRGTIRARAGNPTAIFIRAGSVVFQADAVLAADGGDGLVPRAGLPGAGGEGGSGGGSGSGGHGAYAGYGGSLGRDGLGVHGAAGGRGWGATYTGNFFWGWGGHGGEGRGCCPPMVPGGAAGNGAGGGGGGSWTSVLTSGGGGGGGLLVIVADRIEGPGVVRAQGGAAGTVPYEVSSGGGGGGVIWLAARSYDGSLSPDVSGGEIHRFSEPGWPGTARILRIMPDGTLRERSFSDSW